MRKKEKEASENNRIMCAYMKNDDDDDGTATHNKTNQSKAEKRIDKTTMFGIFLGCKTFTKVSMVTKPSSSV